jgi:23S rRNA (uracil1939-C5)-methyltransferase
MFLCKYAKKCGGCQLQNLEYDDQLALKQSKVIRLVGKYCRVDDIVGMDEPFHYRNKVQSAFAFRNGRTICGIYQSSTNRIVPVDNCLLEDKRASKIIKTVNELVNSFKIKSYDLSTERGFMRHILVRIGQKTGEIMVVLVTTKGEFPHKNNFVSALLKKHPEITTVVWNINPYKTALMLGDKSEVLFGNGFITDELLGLKFRISPRSFYQVNPIQTEILYKKAFDFANLSGKERVIDCYCGTGTIGLTMAKGAKEVIGVEVNEEAVIDANFNASANGIKNAKFIKADAGEFMQSLAEKGEKADVVITDPPRAGCSAKFLKSVINLAPKRIVYVSCNPETLSRDLFTLRKGGYKVKKIQPVDMFPFTEHVETVCLLSKR